MEQHRQSEPNPRPVDGRQQRLGECDQGVDEGLEGFARGAGSGLSPIVEACHHRSHLFEVGPGAERAAPPGQDDDAHGAVARRGPERRGRCAVQVTVERVCRVRAVEDDGPHASLV